MEDNAQAIWEDVNFLEEKKLNCPHERSRETDKCDPVVLPREFQSDDLVLR